MKSNCAVRFSLGIILGACLSGSGLFAEEAPLPEGVCLKDGVIHMVEGGVVLPMTNEIVFPRSIKVMTNGTFTVANGKERPLAEGEVLGADGMLTSPDGTLRPVFDHITSLKGQIVILQDGQRSQLINDTELPDGRRITTEGYLVKAGVKRKILDGEAFDLSGKEIPINDTITLKDGKVIVQKDGSSLEVAPGRSLMMNNGTKVLGEGTLVMKDGTKMTLTPGEVFKIDGVTPAPKTDEPISLK